MNRAIRWLTKIPDSEVQILLHAFVWVGIIAAAFIIIYPPLSLLVEFWWRLWGMAP